MATYIVYHGTHTRFKKFDLNLAAQGVAWFSDSLEEITSGESGAASTKVVLKCQISINHPAGWEEYEKWSLWEIQLNGYDGVILPVKPGVNNFIIFKSNQAKILGDVPTVQEQMERMRRLF